MSFSQQLLLVFAVLSTFCYCVCGDASSSRDAKDGKPTNFKNNYRSHFHLYLTSLQKKMVAQAKENYKSGKKLNITCPELNVTFTNDPPFGPLGVPECKKGVQPKMMLYLPGDTECLLNPFNLPNEDTNHCIESLKKHPNVNKIMVVIHGFLKSFDTIWMHEMKREIMKLEPDTVVIIVGWGHGFEDILNFWRAAANTRYIGQAMYEVVRAIVVANKKMDRNFYLHCAGHSLGGHACGFLGKHFILDPELPQFDRISGMDPAGPLFCNDIPYPFDHLDIKPSARLGPHDAKLVDVIHTDGDARSLGIVPQYGTMEPLGTVDFYPGENGNYGHNQPGCVDVFNVISCSHSRAWQLYLSSIRDATCLASKKCDGNPEKIPKSCQKLPSGRVVTMGYWWDTNNMTPGMYLVEEGPIEPFCKQ